jgi:putative ABC transport system substrate-binding protein
MALLINSADPALAETESKEVLSGAHALGLDLHVLNASTEGDLDRVFADVIKLRDGGLVIGDAFFTDRANNSPC